MNKINRFLLIYIVTITGLCGYMCYVAFYKEDSAKDKLIHQVQSTITKQEKQTTTARKKKETYGLSIKDGHLVVINNQTKEIFEYTDIEKKNLPADVLRMLEQKKVFQTKEDVYHFLESCSS